jgi:hypothetical protein
VLHGADALRQAAIGGIQRKQFDIKGIRGRAAELFLIDDID